ncbi:PAS domain S-box protein [bacterium]|nr:PAS domain S-box protein [bacterium]MBU1434869.1 PAS domain S-box protein [bacterium]MBU1503974.1 PAS domain S-box protein [bacterium]
MNLQSLPIKVKLSIGFFLITLLGVAIVIFSILEFKRSGSLIERMFYHPYTVSNSVKSIHLDILTIHLLAKSMPAEKEKNNLENILKEIDKLNKDIEANFQLITQRYLGPKEDITKVYKFYEKLRSLRIDYIEMIKNDNFPKAEQCMSGKGALSMQQLEKEMQTLTQYADNKAKFFLQDSIDVRKEMVLYLTIALILLILLSLIIALYTMELIVIPINEVIFSMKRIIDGELNLFNSAKAKELALREDEIGQLFNSFNQAMNYLLLPYNDIINSKGSLVEKTSEIQRLLHSFDKYIIASKTDTRGRIIYASKAFQEISGYSSQELIGNSQSIVNHPDMPKKTFKELWETIRTGVVWKGEIKNKKKDGTFFWINTTIGPDINSKGEIVGYNAISENITDTKAYAKLSKTLEIRVREEMEKNNEKTTQMIQQSRLAQMGEMISMIAHQWRQPLASISAISGTLSLDVMMKNYNEEFFQERLDSIGELSQHLSETINDFRGFFKNDKRKEKANLGAIVDSCMQVIGPSLANKSIHLQIDIDRNIVLNSFISELKQVMLNIFKNAEDALLESKTENPSIWVKGYGDNENIYISIEDNAGGVSENIVNEIFDPYFSTKKQKDGTGLGLYMSKIIVQDHIHGQLVFKNSDVGASFTITIPIDKENQS